MSSSFLPLALLVVLGATSSPSAALPEEGSTPERAEQVTIDPQESGEDEPSESEDANEGQPATPLEVWEVLDVKERADDLVGFAISASEGSTGFLDLQRRPLLRPGDVVETVPGMVATQHSGGGKANQYFVRGFNLDHGTDFAISVGGMPVNMPTHGHGQGYADLNFLIPEVVARARYRKGPYFADVGDFSAAGSLDIDLLRAMPESTALVAAGSFDYGRALYADSFRLGDGDLLLALEAFHDDGPWTRGDDYDGGRGVVRFTAGDSQRGYSLTAMGYDGSWLSTDQIPRRAVDSGRIGRFDLIDPGPRGDTTRFSVSGEGHRADERGWRRISGYLTSYDFDLVSNFTYFLDDPENGDQFRQLDERFIGGLQVDRGWLGRWRERRIETVAGVQLRFDDIDNALLRTRELETVSTTRRDSVQQWTGGPFVESRVRWNDWFRSAIGLRLDGYFADVSSDLAINSGDADDTLLSPKLGLVFGPWSETELYVNFGYGFHSNDARGTVIRLDPSSEEPAQAVQPLVRAEGFDVGVRTSVVPGLHTTLTVFGLELDSELVFVGDGGATEASRPSRRAGVEWSSFYRLNRSISLELDVTLTDAEFRDDDPAGNEIPGAVGETVGAGISWDDLGPWSATLRWRYFGDVPLIEDGSVVWDRSSSLNGAVGYDFRSGLFLRVEGFNLLDQEDSDIEYFYPSRLPGEPLDGIEDVHFHPLPSRSARLMAGWRW